MEEEQIENQGDNKYFQAVVKAIDDVKSKLNTKEYVDYYREFGFKIYNLRCIPGGKITIEEAEQILEKMGDEVKFDSNLLSCFFDVCPKVNSEFIKNIFAKSSINFVEKKLLSSIIDVCESSLDYDLTNWILKLVKEYNGYFKLFDKKELLIKFFNVCDEESLKKWNIEGLDLSAICDDSLFKSFKEINSELNNETSKKIFRDLYEMKRKRQKEELREVISKEKPRNRKRKIFGIIGVIIAGLFGLGTIGFVAWAIGVGALAATTVTAIAVPVAVVALALISICSYFIDKFRVRKVSIEIAEELLSDREYDKNKTPRDLSNRSEIKGGLEFARNEWLHKRELNEREM